MAMKTTRVSDNIIIFLIVIIIPLNPLAMDLYFPSLPAMVTSLYTTKTLIQLTLTVYILGLGLSQLFYGPLSDRFGRRGIILIGTTIFLLASIACTFATDVNQLLLFRFMQGIGYGCGFVVASAIMADAFTGKKLAKISSYSAMSYSITPIIAPVIGGYIQDYIGWRANFSFMAIYALILLFLIFFLLPETNKYPDRNAMQLKSFVGGYCRMTMNPNYLGYILLMSLSYGIMIVFSIVGPFLLQKVLHLSAVEYGKIALLIGLSYLIGTTVNSHLVKIFSIYHLLMLGIGLMLISSIALVITSAMGLLSIVEIIAPTCVAILGMGFVFPNAMAGALALFPEHTGRSSALMGSFTLFGCTLISVITAHLHTQTEQPLAFIYLVLSLLAVLALFLAHPGASKNCV